MNNLRSAQQAWDAMLPEEYPEITHRYTGEVLVGEYCFNYVYGDVKSVSYYNDADEFVEVPYSEWKGDNDMEIEADAVAHEEWLEEVRNAH